ncbi:MAG: GTP pyrophosphokinase [Okeania sp. SIO3B3]|nr:GTP pyrophosphokinase [Okeania sp. SIO3B3]
MLDKAILIAAQAHLGQTDRADAPYILHPLRVMFHLESETEMTIAILHDVVEDNPAWTLDRLCAEGFSEEVVAAVDCLTRREDESYDAYIDRIGANPLARRVKLADLHDNMNIKRLPAMTEKNLHKIARYHQAWLKLAQM